MSDTATRLHAVFPLLEFSVIETVLAQHDGDADRASDQLLALSDPAAAGASAAHGASHAGSVDSLGGTSAADLDAEASASMAALQQAELDADLARRLQQQEHDEAYARDLAYQDEQRVRAAQVADGAKSPGSPRARSGAHVGAKIKGFFKNRLGRSGSKASVGTGSHSSSAIAASGDAASGDATSSAPSDALSPADAAGGAGSEGGRASVAPAFASASAPAPKLAPATGISPASVLTSTSAAPPASSAAVGPMDARIAEAVASSSLEPTNPFAADVASEARLGAGTTTAPAGAPPGVVDSPSVTTDPYARLDLLG
ncbi:hypothetical protein CXG81DRAFT_21375 [Caulochytrium protostelioides]|uniref:CUE domain-containing protein n=1 Tax=Caulochytrium protostelioides TaxID=1555241 RepID=A0A4P9X0A3_9FUNG|nr:hypothetical protein CXG81DRAFT_21375 [Caulochytrium protostelioides]|eukprot:RKO98382.1 hypothetical protein CXG81DRAFT_21375 [Caulochytrium protostelioides]